MGWFTYKCPEHGDFKLILERRKDVADCPTCGVASKPVIKIGTTQVIEKLDNGVMGRAVERLHDIENIMEERSKQDDERYKEQRGLSDEDEE
jgi:hypothetical protein